MRRGEISRAAAGAILTIDLGAIRANYRLLSKKLGATKCAAVVKADGYGLGGVEVAHALQQDGCDTFFVAHVSAGIKLRKALGASPAIFVLNGLPPGSERECASAGLVPVLNSLDQIEAWRGLASRSGRPLPAALQVDSGMARMGMAPSEVDRLAADPSLLDGIDVALVMSHLACADEPGSAVNGEQLRRFKALRKKLPAAPASLANCSGIFLGKAFHFDLARPGVALYGVNPTPGKPNPMKPVVRLDAKVIQTRDVPKGEGIGYGHTFRTKKALRAATISLGYADGWQRRANGKAFFNGVPLPFLGRVSMDSIVLDISSLAEDAIRAGDLVELIGPNQTVDDVARLSGTIGYEILTGLGDRFHRVYLGGGAE